MNDDGRTGNHWNGLVHPRLSLDVGLLRIRSGVLVKVGLVRIIGVSDEWNSLYTVGVLRVAARGGIRG